MQNDDEALTSISSACHGQLVKILITLEPLVYFDQFCLLMHFKIV